MERLTVLVAACLALPASPAQAQMMGGGRDVRAGREVMNERLANSAPGQRAMVDAVRGERAGTSTTWQRITLRAGIRSYVVSSAEVSESHALMTYSLRRPSFRLGIAGGPLRFSSGDSLRVAGVTPFKARLDVALRARDSVQVSVRAPSSPTSLSGAQLSALASISTSTIDFSSVELGTPASLALRYAHARPLGTTGSLSVTLGADYEPRPGDTGWSYWRGKTLRAGATGATSAGRSRLSVGVDLSRSWADSLGGRNLFPGGGTLLVRAGAASSLGAGEAVLLDVSAFYFRTFQAERAPAGSRRAPSGAFLGANALGIWSVGELLLVPALAVSHEAGRSTSLTAPTTGSGWAIGSSLAADIPIGGRFSLTPELGYSKGALRSGGTGASGGRSESLSGWWLAADLSFSF